MREQLLEFTTERPKLCCDCGKYIGTVILIISCMLAVVTRLFSVLQFEPGFFIIILF